MKMHIITGEEEEGAAPAEEGAGEPTGIRAIYEQLAACTTSERADETAINFCLIQTKSVPYFLHYSWHHNAWKLYTCL